MSPLSISLYTFPLCQQEISKKEELLLLLSAKPNRSVRESKYNIIIDNNNNNTVIRGPFPALTEDRYTLPDFSYTQSALVSVQCVNTISTSSSSSSLPPLLDLLNNNCNNYTATKTPSSLTCLRSLRDHFLVSFLLTFLIFSVFALCQQQQQQQLLTFPLSLCVGVGWWWYPNNNCTTLSRCERERICC